MTYEYKADATITETEFNDLCTVIEKASEHIDEMEWLDDCVETAKEETGIELSGRLNDRAVHALELIIKGYAKLNDYVNYGFVI